MTTKVLIIAGTLAPSQSEKIYYHRLLKSVREVTEKVEFCVIPQLGLGNIVEASHQVKVKYLCCRDDKYIFIGHSQGGIIASLLGMWNPSQTLAVICLATPLGGTLWTDPLALPFRVVNEIVTVLTAGRVKSWWRIPKLELPFNVPVVSDLSRHSEVLDQIQDHLIAQTTPYTTYSIIGAKDMIVLPRRSAYIAADHLVHYLVLSRELHTRLKPVLPADILAVYSRVGHISIVQNPNVLELVKALVHNHTA